MKSHWERTKERLIKNHWDSERGKLVGKKRGGWGEERSCEGTKKKAGLGS